MRISAIHSRKIGTQTSGSAGGDAGIVEVATRDGMTGTAYGPTAAADEAAELGTSLLVGEGHSATAAHWKRLCSENGNDNTSRTRLQARAMLDVALWDLKAKSDGEPLWRSLGAARPRVNVCARSPDLDEGGLNRWFRNMADAHGCRAGMVPLRGVNDVARLLAARGALATNANSPDLLAVAPPGWSGPQAAASMREIERHLEIACLLASLADWGEEVVAEVSRSVGAALCPIAAPATATGLFTETGARYWDVLLIDPAISGISGSLQIAEAAYGYELPVIAAASPGNLSAHLAAAFPNIMYVEVGDPAGDALGLTSDVRFEGGRARAGDEPGHGIRFAAGGGDE